MKTAKEKEIQGESLTIKDTTEKEHFIIVYEPIYKANLSAEALALIVKLIANAPTFKPTILKLATILKTSEKAIKKASKELQEKGFLKIEHHGKSGSAWLINQKGTYKKANIEELKTMFINGEIGFKTIEYLFKSHQITKEERKALYDELIKIAKTNIYNED